MHTRNIVGRDGGAFDNLPWGWASSPQSKRDAYSSAVGRDYRRGSHPSAYHVLAQMIHNDCKANLSHVIIENTDLLGDLVLGGALLLSKRSPSALGSPEFTLCACTTDEAVGLSLATDCPLLLDRSVYVAAALPPRYSTQQGRLRLQLDMPDSDSPTAQAEAGLVAPLPWEIRSAEELLQLPLEIKARSALAAGLNLPRAREATDEARATADPLACHLAFRAPSLCVCSFLPRC